MMILKLSFRIEETWSQSSIWSKEQSEQETTIATLKGTITKRILPIRTVSKNVTFFFILTHLRENIVY